MTCPNDCHCRPKTRRLKMLLRRGRDLLGLRISLTAEESRWREETKLELRS